MEMDAKKMSGDKSFVLLAHWNMLEGDISSADEHLTLVNFFNIDLSLGQRQQRQHHLWTCLA
jgi:hypothetical protein